MWCPQHLITLQQCRAIQHETTWVCPRRRIRGLCVRKKGDSYVLTYNDYEDEQGNARKGVKKTLEAGQSSSKFCACWQPTDRSLFCLGMFKETYSLHWISLIIQKSCFAAPLVCFQPEFTHFHIVLSDLDFWLGSRLIRWMLSLVRMVPTAVWPRIPKLEIMSMPSPSRRFQWYHVNVGGGVPKVAERVDRGRV